MGGNGSFFSGITNFENGRMYKTISSIGDNIKVLETKNPKAGVKLPEESHTLTTEMKKLINKIINFKK